MFRGNDAGGGTPPWWTAGAGARHLATSSGDPPVRIEAAAGVRKRIAAGALSSLIAHHLPANLAAIAERSEASIERGSARPAGAAAAVLARFIPGLPIGIAAVESALASAVDADPGASSQKKRAARLAAASSWVAGSNVPVVSQLVAEVALALGKGPESR